MHSKPLVQLTRKNVDFEFGEEQLLAMEKLKYFVKNCSAIRAIDYESKNEVVLAVDSSWMAVGFILSQQGDDGKRYPSRFGSITWNEVEQKYSQAKLELYGLFRALKATRTFIIGVENLVVEVDAKYIKGMINNPDIQPNATINRWIAGILLFDFRLRHVSAKDHAPADGLSRRPKGEEEQEDEEDVDEWIDLAYSFGIECLNMQQLLPSEDAAGSGVCDRISQTAKPSKPGTRTVSPKTLIASFAVNVLKIPRSIKSQARDEKIKQVEEFLRKPSQPLGLSDQELQRFVRIASEFFLLDDQLWRKDRHGKHKLVIKEGKRLGLIKQAHDDLGHKGVYTVRTRLAERFWWPHLEADVKWFIRTCHECQVRQVKKIIIPPSVPPPAGLFRKVYIDTMLMPKAKGF
jgi:hypothetical protein